MKTAFKAKQKIIVLGDSIFGGPRASAGLTVREINGALLAFQPRKRRYHVPVIGQPCKVLAA